MAQITRTVGILLVAGAAVVLWAGTGWDAPGPSGAPVPSGTSIIQHGRQLYTEHCASCHGPGGVGTAQGPGLIDVGPAAVDFMLSTGRMPLAEPDQPTLRQTPKFSHAGMDAIIAYVQSLGPGGVPIPTIQPQHGDLTRGQRLFSDNCAACHGADGQGASVGEGQVAPSLHGATATQIAEAVRIGPGPMPKFGPKELPTDALNSLVRYVLFLQRAPDPGGLVFGHEGPVIEGFVAWFVGLGLMVLVTRMIGTTT
jgi:ubiquinol-cytochrome c reductase cytochrome c subunit